MRFIPIERMRRLREAAKGGDDRARKIIKMQLDGKDDFSTLLEEYFAVKEEKPEEPMAPVGDNLGGGDSEEDPKLAEFLKLNEITKDSPEYDSFVAEYKNEMGEGEDKPEIPEEAEEPETEAEQAEEVPAIEPAETEEVPVAEPSEAPSVIDPLIADEIEAIEGYQKALLLVISDDGIGDAAKKGLIADLEEIKRDEMEHLDKLRRMKASIEKKEEAKSEPEEVPAESNPAEKQEPVLNTENQ